MNTQKKNFLGIPIEGDITKSNKRAEQKPVEEFTPLVQALLDDPTIVEFGWYQYTPYFNDGEPCVFSAGELWVRLTTSPEDADTVDLSLRYPSERVEPHLGEEKIKWIKKYSEYETEYEGPDEERFQRALALHNAIDSGQFDDVLMDTFGDHAGVTVKRDRIAVEFYEHD